MSAFGSTLSPALQRLGGVSVKLSVELGSTNMALKDVLALAEGSVVSLDKLTDELLDITANGQVIAHGEVIAQDGKFALRIVSLAGGDGPAASPSSSAPRPDIPAAPPAELEVPSPQPSVEPTKKVSAEAEAQPAPAESETEPLTGAADADALLDALDELTDAPSPDSRDEPEADDKV